MATHSSTLAWRIPWMEEPARLQSMGLQRVGHDFTFTFTLLLLCLLLAIHIIVKILFYTKKHLNYILINYLWT